MVKEKYKVTYNIFKYILGLLFNVYYRPKYINKSFIPKDGPIILCGNHMHLFDQNLVIFSTKRMIHYMAKKEYFDNKKVSWFFKLSGCISVNRQRPDGSEKTKALEILSNNYALGIFPEGTRNRTHEFLLPFKYGAVSLAQKSKATIIPFAITGSYKFWNNHLNIRFGDGFKIPDGMNLEKANKILYEKVSSLKREGINDIEKGVI